MEFEPVIPKTNNTAYIYLDCTTYLGRTQYNRLKPYADLPSLIIAKIFP